MLSALPTELRLRGLSPEQRLAGLTPEQRLAALTPVLPEAALRALPADYLATLSDATRDAIRKRLDRS
jgi:hypothetical protein